MELFLVLLAFGIIIFTEFADVILLEKIDEEDIEKNMNLLKKSQWFQSYLQNGIYREQIIHDKHVRNTIGKFNTKKLKKDSFPKKYQVRLEKALQANSL